MSESDISSLDEEELTVPAASMATTTVVTAATYGRIAEFNQETDNWNQYVERLDFYFVANDIKDEVKQKAIFLSACGSGVYATLRDLCQQKISVSNRVTMLGKLLFFKYFEVPRRFH